MIYQIKLLSKHIDFDKKIKFLLLIFLSVLLSIFEVFTIGSILPFVSVIVDPEIVYNNQYINIFFPYIKNVSEKNLLLYLCIIFSFLAIIATFLKIFQIYYNAKFSFEMGSDLNAKMLSSILNLDYLSFKSYNSSNVINTLAVKSNYMINNIILGFVQFISNTIIFISIIILLLVINIKITLFLFISVLVGYSMVFQFSKTYFSNFSDNLSIQSDQIVQTITESIGAYKEISLSNKQNVAVFNFKDYDLNYRKALSFSIFATQFPRFALEGIILVIVSIVLFLSYDFSDSSNSLIPTFAAFGLAAQKLLPISQQLYKNISEFRIFSRPFEDCLDILTRLNLHNDNYCFTKEEKFSIESLHLSNISFSYDNSPIFKNLSMDFKKNNSYLITGKTGSGKSTLIDILLGFLKPSNGNLFVNNTVKLDKNYQANIAYVPQLPFIYNENFCFNITLEKNIENIDIERLNDAIKLSACDFINENNLFDISNVGEFGNRLSGGQKQRLSIARALYKKSQLLIMDEPTSALDKNTESILMNNILTHYQGRNVVVISHNECIYDLFDYRVNLDEFK